MKAGKRTLYRIAGIALFGAAVVVVVLWLLGFFAPSLVFSGPRARFQAGDSYLTIEFLDDDLVHLEYRAGASPRGLDEPLPTTAMVYKRDYPGPSHLASDGRSTLETPEIRLQVDRATLCVAFTAL